ncbi:MAG: hypothetical protein ACR2OR_06125 [Hyphomicrobiales bacterium]
MTPKLLKNTIVSAVLGFALFVGAGAVAPQPAHAQATHCAAHQKVGKLLGERFKETRRAVGLLSASKMIEVYVSSGGTWTIVYTHPDGLSCIGAVGEHWQELKPELLSG